MKTYKPQTIRPKCETENCSHVVFAAALCSKHYSKKFYSKNRADRIAACRRYQKTDKGRFKIAKGIAKRRGLTFDLSFEDFVRISSAPCLYCNGFFDKGPSHTHLDRVDSAIGYEKSNVVSCCTICNRLKGEHFNLEEAKAAVAAIISLKTKGVYLGR